MEEVQEAPKRIRRRGLVIGGLAALGGALVGRVSEAKAIVTQGFGGQNKVATPTTLEYIGDPKLPAFTVLTGPEEQGENRDVAYLGAGAEDPNQVASAWFRSPTNHGVVAIQGDRWEAPQGLGKQAMIAIGQGEAGGIWAYAQSQPATWSWSLMSAGVFGWTTADYMAGNTADSHVTIPPAGVFGRSNKTIGVAGVSESNIGGWFAAGNPPVSPEELEEAGAHFSGGGDLDAACGKAFGMGAGLMGESMLGIGVHGMTMNPASPFEGGRAAAEGTEPPAGVTGHAVGKGMGVCGMSANGIGGMFESGPDGFGVWSLIGSMFFDPLAQTPSAVKGAAGNAGTYGVSGLTRDGTALMGRVQKDGTGLALGVDGPSAFSTVKRVVVPAGQTRARIPLPAPPDAEFYATPYGPTAGFYVQRNQDGTADVVLRRKQGQDVAFAVAKFKQLPG